MPSAVAPALVSETYEPHFQPVNVAALGEELLAGRTVTGDFADGQVLLDPLLCHLMLENAIGQALRPGWHSAGPWCGCLVSFFFVRVFSMN